MIYLYLIYLLQGEEVINENPAVMNMYRRTQTRKYKKKTEKVSNVDVNNVRYNLVST